jgi:hypothetical protein
VQLGKMLEAAVNKADPARRDRISNPIGYAKHEFNRWRQEQAPPPLRIATG